MHEIVRARAPRRIKLDEALEIATALELPVETLLGLAGPEHMTPKELAAKRAAIRVNIEKHAASAAAWAARVAELKEELEEAEREFSKAEFLPRIWLLRHTDLMLKGPDPSFTRRRKKEK